MGAVFLNQALEKSLGIGIVPVIKRPHSIAVGPLIAIGSIDPAHICLGLCRPLSLHLDDLLKKGPCTREITLRE